MKARERNNFDVWHAKGVGRLLGALGLVELAPSSGVYIETRWIHTFGMRFSIDCVALDAKNCVLAIRRNVKPLRFVFWPGLVSAVLEISANSAAVLEIAVGDQLSFSWVARATIGSCRNPRHSEQYRVGP